jgi:hypothetical protein
VRDFDPHRIKAQFLEHLRDAVRGVAQHHQNETSPC